jgi:hypothetical protein
MGNVLEIGDLAVEVGDRRVLSGVSRAERDEKALTLVVYPPMT